MVGEKAQSAYDTALVLATNRGNRSVAAALAPWHRRATANAKRLRKK